MAKKIVINETKANVTRIKKALNQHMSHIGFLHITYYEYEGETYFRTVAKETQDSERKYIDYIDSDYNLM